MGPSLLFCPADRPDRFEKAAARADAVILDLEDAVAPEHKGAARDALTGSSLDPVRTIVRLNAFDSGFFADDLVALAHTPYRTVMVAKSESAEQLSGLDRFSVIALCETATGVLAAPSIAALPQVVALMWGAEDLVASLGGTSSRFADGTYRDIARHARSSVLLAAGASGKAAIDAVHVDIADLEGLDAEARDAAASGFAASAVIHPSQVETVRAAFRPTDAELDAARRIVEAAASNGGVFRLDGRMVDGPVVRHAERVLARVRPTMD
ncbi:CoA ester lyase [Glaciihabitans arcticus]|uniref:CoA ester lyase n=1 Tax=Glaciihabitans arcticus TaxID=2668039 RepID=A0A4Q9GUU2_9MICO|nr:CoA ester lyase [Glaciihabitans arcticus]TBN58555.1 CoA ester lyase [Glaciihabitans arcticus]